MMKFFTLKDKSVTFKLTVLIIALILTLLLWLIPEHKDDSSYSAAETEAAISQTIEDIDTGESEDFFALYRTERRKQRDQKEELYTAVMADTSLTAEEKEGAKEDLENLYYRSGLEDKVETILKGRNYEDVIFSYEEPLSLLIIKASSLSSSEEKGLRDFIAVYCGIDSASLSVFTIY